MAFRVLERVWDPETPANADWSSEAEQTVLLLDGAAPVAPERVSSCANDTVWLVRRFAEHFATTSASRAASGASDVPARAEAARRELEREYAALCHAAGSIPAETPFACLAIAEDAGARIELFNMGDQTTLVLGAHGLIAKLGESSVRELDRQALELLMRAAADGVEPHAVRHAQVRPQILAHRALRNQLPGYDVLDVRVACDERFERRSLDRQEVRHILMMSDGFYRLVDTVGRYSDASLLDAVQRVGLAPLLAELRSIESEDPECLRYPRFKRHDDATALWLSLDAR